MKPLLAAMLVLCAGTSQARPTVLELFTSQACSSCPPADALLTRYAQLPNILALSFNITYWNSPAYTDPYGLTAATDRQAWYAGLKNSQNVYTPEMVVDGAASMVGSDEGSIRDAIAAARASPAGNIPINLSTTTPNMLTLTIAPGAGTGEIRLFGYDPQHTTPITGGENAGATLTETNIVLSITDLGPWLGNAVTLTITRPAGTRTAAILQTNTGAVLGAATD